MAEEEKKEPKPALQTTEFYLVALGQICAALLASGLIEDIPEAVRIVSIILVVLGGLGYAGVRTWAKK